MSATRIVHKTTCAINSTGHRGPCTCGAETAATVWKFPLRWGEVSVDMPKHAHFVHVGRDPSSDYPAIWALVKPDQERETRTFAVVGSGFDVPAESVHIGSLIDGSFVWHIFETTPEKVLGAMLGAFRGF